MPTVDILHFPYPEYHSSADRPELVDERLLADSVALALELVRDLAASPR